MTTLQWEEEKKSILTNPLSVNSNAPARVRVDDKRIINCRADVNQLMPIKYQWAWKSIWPVAPITGCRMKFPCSVILNSGKIRMI